MMGEGREMARQRYLSTGSKKVKKGQFSVGDKVTIQDVQSKLWDTEATIESVRDSGRSYWCMSADGRSYLRNRKFLKRAMEPAADRTMQAQSGDRGVNVSI